MGGDDRLRLPHPLKPRWTSKSPREWVNAPMPFAPVGRTLKSNDAGYVVEPCGGSGVSK